jgi:hypothetical protein
MYFRNIKNKAFSNATKQLMYSIPDASSAEEVYNLLELIEKTEETGTQGKFKNLIISKF